MKIMILKIYYYYQDHYINFEKAGKVMEEVKKWIEYKSQLDMAKLYER